MDPYIWDLICYSQICLQKNKKINPWRLSEESGFTRTPPNDIFNRTISIHLELSLFRCHWSPQQVVNHIYPCQLHTGAVILKQKTKQSKQHFGISLRPLSQKPPSYKVSHLHWTPSSANCKTNGLISLKKLTDNAFWSACFESIEQKSQQGRQSKNKTLKTVVMFYGRWRRRDKEACFGFTGQ